MRAYTEKSNLLAKQRFYEEMAPNDLSRAFYIHKSGNVLGWRIVRRGGAALSYDAGNRSFSPFDVLPEDKAVNLVPYDYVNGKIAEVNESIRTADERPESFYLGNVKVMNTPDGLMCQLPGSSDYTPLRTDISDIKEGDAFVAGPINAWSRSRVCIATYDANQNLDEPDEPWIVHDDKLNSWFEEDICTDPYILESFMTLEHRFRKDLGIVIGVIDDFSKIRNSKEISAFTAEALDRYIAEFSDKRRGLEHRLSELMDAAEHSQAHGAEKSSLSDQIRQAATRTAPANAEKGPRNIHKDR